MSRGIMTAVDTDVPYNENALGELKLRIISDTPQIIIF